MRGFLLALVLLAAVTDIRSRRIPNQLTLAGVLAGFVVHVATEGVGGLRIALFGMLTGFGVYFVLYLLRAMGAGDVKLMAAVGAIAGPSNWLRIFVATALVGGLLAIVMMVWKRRVRGTLWNVAFIVNELAHFRVPYHGRGELDVRDPDALKLPHAVAIAAGTITCLLMGRIS